MTNKIGPNDLGKHPDVIKKAQQDLMGMDVLVCGGCHAAFHYINDFEEHKENCKGEVNQTKFDAKQSWAFALWKSAQPAGSGQNPWKLYQNWVQMDSKQQAVWIAAGNSIQTISRIGQGTVQETQVKVVRTVTGPVKVAEPGTKIDQDSDSSVKAEKSAYQKAEQKPTAPGSLVGTVIPGTQRYMVKRTMNSSASHIEVRECAAERVTSRRFNGKRNTFEYQVKWVDYENTWEPDSHFDKARELIEDCHRKLAKQKSAAAAAAASTAAGSNPSLQVTSAAASPQTPNTAGRPERSSKARAVNTLRSWCNTDDKNASTIAPAKRKNTDSDYAEGESSQDESFTASPSPSKVVIKAAGATPVAQPKSGVRYYQKAVNGTAVAVSAATAEVVIDKAGDKVSGVRRKPGAVTSPVVAREAQVRVVGKNETTSSGIVRVGKQPAAAIVKTVGSPAGSPTPPVPPPGSRVQKVLQTTRNASGQTVKRMVYRTVPASTPIAGKASPVASAVKTPARTPVSASRVPATSPHTYQVNRAGVTRQSTAAAAAATTSPVQKGLPATTATRVVRTPAAKPLKPVITPTRVTRHSPNVSPVATVKSGTKSSAASDASTVSADGDMTLCPVTGKLVSKGDVEGSAGEDADSELQRLLTNEEEAVMQAAVAAAEAAAGDESAAVGNTQIAELIQNEDGSPVMVTGEDGTVYQVAGKNSEGQTLLFTQGEEGEQQCVIMATPEDGVGLGDGALAGTGEEGGAGAGGDGAQSMLVDGDSQDGQITAELVQADEPSADGTRRVVLLLPDGNLMVSELNEEQYQQFNLGS